MASAWERTFAWVAERQKAYRLTFRPSRPIMVWKWAKRKAYQIVFSLQAPAHLVVLNDIIFFCRINESCVVPGDRDKTLLLEGRREMGLRILQNLNLTPEQVFQLYGGQRSPDKDTSK